MGTIEDKQGVVGVNRRQKLGCHLKDFYGLLLIAC